MTGFLVFLLYAVASVVFGTVTGLIWQSKGGRFRSGYWWGLLGILGLFYVAFAKPTRGLRTPVTGDTVTVTSVVKLDGGGRIPKGYSSTVLATDIIDGHDVVSIRGPKRTHWVGIDMVSVTAMGVPAERQCPRCAEVVKAEAQVCRFCGEELAVSAH